MTTRFGDRQLDSKGRITIPQSVRDRLDLTPGDYVGIDVENGAVVIRPRVSRDAFVDQMEGCINEDTRDDDTPSLTPEALKADWLSDLTSDD